VVGGHAVLGARPGVRSTRLTRFPESVTIPVVSLGIPSATLAISPGDKVAFVGVRDGQGALYLRRLDRFEAARLPNTGSATAPFFSPDGERLGFFARGRLWRIDLPDGVPIDVGPAPKDSVGGSWGEDGRIVYTPSWSDALWVIPERGGESRAFTKIDQAGGSAMVALRSPRRSGRPVHDQVGFRPEQRRGGHCHRGRRNRGPPGLDQGRQQASLPRQRTARLHARRTPVHGRVRPCVPLDSRNPRPGTPGCHRERGNGKRLV
jgi:hypothetical protein